MVVLVIAEHDHASLSSVTLNVVSAAKQLSEEVELLVAGFHCESVVDECRQITGVSKVWVADHACFAHPLAEVFAPLVLEVGKLASHWLAASSTWGKNLMPRVAAMRDVSQVSDIIEIVDEKTYRRPIYAGNAIALVQSLDSLQVLTVRTTAFSPATKDDNHQAEVVAVDKIIDNDVSRYVGQEVHGGDRPALTAADIVVSGGRGLQDQPTFERLAAIADRMGAALGASRAAVDAGLAPNDYQVGQTGQIVAPKLYIAVGISGAIQHVAGMKDSEVIVAINKDPDAPIFEIADYGLVADLNDVLLEWENILSEMGC